MTTGKMKFPLRGNVAALYPYFRHVCVFSVVVNVLVLVPSAYMMQVYERVTGSRSFMTLLMLTILVIGLYVVLEILEWVRRQVMLHAGAELERNVREQVFSVVFTARLQGYSATGLQPLHDLKTIREFFPSHAMQAIIDAPLALLVLGLIFLMNPFLGWFAVAGALAQFGIGFFNERNIREPLVETHRNSTAARNYAESAIRKSQVIESMGMLEDIHGRWMNFQQEFLVHQAKASDLAGTNAVVSKLVQSLTSSLLLGLGCWLTLRGELHGAGMIVASILGGRVLSPLVQIIGNWRQVEIACEAFNRLEGLMTAYPLKTKGMPLPAPDGALSVESLFTGAPGSSTHIIRGVSFRLPAGSSVAIVGPSASGKTVLSRLLAGIWPAMQGKVRLDGNDIYRWDKEELGQYIGYLPQNVELLEGTISENISRFGEPDSKKVREACRMAGLEDMIEQFPQGYETIIGDDGSFLSGGERQRVALARAVYGMPKLVVLDEPDSSLDEQGIAALISTIKRLKAAGTTVIVITHRVNILVAIEHLLVLVDGQVQQFGSCREVLAMLQSPPVIHQSKN